MPPPAENPRAKFDPGTARAWAAGWDYKLARAAVDEHLRGRFLRSYQLAIDLERHPAAKAARRQRRSAVTSQPWILRGPTRAPGKIELQAAARTWAKIKPLLGGIVDDLAVHGLCVLQHPVAPPDEETKRYEIASVEIWPLACVELGSALLARDGAGPYEPDRLYARTVGGPRLWEPLPNPGETDLHWTVFGDPNGWQRGAIVACDLEYVAAQMGRRAWAKLQNQIGKASNVAELPPNVPMFDTKPDGTVGENPVASATLDMVTALGEEQIAGIMQNGGEVHSIQVTATTADLLPQSIDASREMFALAILGHAGAVTRSSSVYSDPAAQAVPQDLARDDAQLIAAPIAALLTGVARLNCERCADIWPDPQIPDSDQDMRREAVQKRRKADDEHRAAQLAACKAAADAVAAERAAGGVVDADRVAELYALGGLPPPRLAPQATPAPAAPTPAPPPAPSPA